MVEILRDEAKIGAEQSRAFVAECAKHVQDVECFRTRLPFGEIRDELEQLADKIHHVQTLINTMSSDARDFIDLFHVFIVYPDLPPWPESIQMAVEQREGEGLLSLAWDSNEALEGMARAAASVLDSSVDRMLQPKKEVGELLTGLIVDEYVKQFGDLPLSGQQSWFVHFMQLIGERLDLVCGPRVVARVVKERRSGGDAVART